MKLNFSNRHFLKFALVLLLAAFFNSSCGYRIVGSEFLTFQSVTIASVKNQTYEPKLEERLHIALSREFIRQGIEVKIKDGDVDLEATVTLFQLGAVGAVDEIIREQEIILEADIKVDDQGKIAMFKSMRSPLKITFQSTGSVNEAAARKDIATEKACSEIAKEIVGQLIVRYAK